MLSLARMVLRKAACAALVVEWVVLALSGAARAESATPAPGTSKALDGGLAVYLFAGHAGWDTTALDARLTSLGYSSFSQNPGSGGIGMRGWMDVCSCMGDMEFQFSIASAPADDGAPALADRGTVRPPRGTHPLRARPGATRTQCSASATVRPT